MVGSSSCEVTNDDVSIVVPSRHRRQRRRLREIHHTVLFTRGFTPSDWPVEEQAGFVSEIWGDELEEYQDLSAEMEQRRSELNIAERARDVPMSSTSIPRSAALTVLLTLHDVQRGAEARVIRTAINYCSTVVPSIADLTHLRDTVENDRVLQKKERRALQRVIGKYSKQRLESAECQRVGWVKSDLWDAHRP